MDGVLTLAELTARLSSPLVAEGYTTADGVGQCLLVALPDNAATPPLVQPALPVIGIGNPDADAPDVIDLVIAEDDVGDAVEAVTANPIAATVMVQLLRHNETASVRDGLFAESLAYSSLQHGAEFERWLAGRQAKPATDDPEPAVLTARSGATLDVTLNRPHKRNAYSASLRDALCDALQVPLADPTIEVVELRGNGAAFSAGGDLDEFGEARDAAIAHVSRMSRSAGRLLAELAPRVHAHLHGACIGAGIELPAFAGRVYAQADTFFQLPEVAMGLIPGAGGTASIIRRIGRRRTAWLALSNRRLDAETALHWGLIDAIEPD